MESVASLIVSRLRGAGVSALFGMPGGGSNLDLIEAARQAGLPFVLTATETGGALAATAQAEIAGRPGACLTTLGPGVASVVNGVACAHLDRAPLVVLTDNHPAAACGTFAHQRLDHQALLAPVTTFSATIAPDNAGDVVDRAIACAIAPPPGPVHLDLAADVAGQEAARAFQARDGGPERAALQLSTDDRRLLTAARRPLILVGLAARRVVDAAAIRSLCERHSLPAMVTYKAKGVVPDTSPHFAGVFTHAAIEQPILDQADLLIGVGLDPVELLPRPWKRAQPIVHCGPWSVEDRHVPFAAQLVGDVPAALAHIEHALSRSTWDLDAVGRAVAAQREAISPAGETLSAHRVVHIAAGAAATVARVTVDAGAHMLPATMLWPVSEPNQMLISNGLSTMGFALPAAIGAALLHTRPAAHHNTPVVALTGDGGLLMCAGELLTAVREQLRVITIVFNDRSLTLIDLKQRQRQYASVGVTLGDVAWASVADSFGMPAHVAVTERDLDRALARALDHQGPSLIDARIDPSTYPHTLRAVRG